jgi:cytochrome c oxidase assembly factor CtaG
MMTNLDVLTQLWNWHSPAWTVTFVAAVLYLAIAGRRHASALQITFFAISAGAFLIALASPLTALASRYLFSAHMAQHLLLLLIVPLCAILAWPSPAGEFAENHAGHPPRGSVPLGWAAGVGAMWFWHIPALCTASMRSPIVFDIQLVSLVAAGAAFWLPVFGPITSQRMQPHLAAIYLFAGCLGCSLLGIYIAFSPVAVCPLYLTPTGSFEILHLVRDQWGFSSRVDQQVGGLLMWVPACMIYLGAILAKLSSWYHVPGPSHTAANSLATEV